MENKNKIIILGLSGSLRTGSITRRAVDIALEGAQELGAETQHIDLLEYDLKFSDLGAPVTPDNVLRLRQKLQSAHGMILGTPEYHGGLSGVLKHTLDLMGFKEFEGKMLGLVGVSGGKMGATNSLNSLRTVGRSLHAWVVPEQVSLPEAWRLFDRTGQLKEPEIAERLMDVGRQVARFAYLHQAAESLDFLRKWEIATDNPGGEIR
jgi:NAD(P)H-dependent FMN reductase